MKSDPCPAFAESSNEPSVAALVLAAGRSSRMGRFKPLLPFGSGTVLSHIVGVLRQAGVGAIRVVYGHNAAIMAPALRRLGVTGVENPDFDRGMLSSVKRGIASLPADVGGCLVLPVDMPLVRPSTVKRVLRTARGSGAPLVYPTMDGHRGHPPLIGRSLFGDILTRDEEGGLRAILARHEADAVEIPVFDTGCLRDMDYPDDHRLLVQALARRHAPDAEECEAMLDAAAVSEPVRRHCRAVADLAVLLAEGLVQSGLDLDVDMVRAGALLHDIAKGQPHHAEAGATLVRGFGFPAVADIVARHMALNAHGTRIDETAVVYLADKLVKGERRVTLEERFGASLQRFADDPEALAGVYGRWNDAAALLQAIGQHLCRADAPLSTAVPELHSA